MTLVPPWETEEFKVASEELKAVEFQSIEIHFDKIVFGPNAKEPRMIWASGSPPSQLITLKEKIQKTLTNINDGRHLYKLHVTLAKMKNYPAQKSSEIAKVSLSLKADRFVLYESHLSSAGADYEVLGE